MKRLIAVLLSLAITPCVLAATNNINNCPWNNPANSWIDYISSGTTELESIFFIEFDHSRSIRDSIYYEGSHDAFGSAWKGERYLVSYVGNNSVDKQWLVENGYYEVSLGENYNDFMDAPRRYLSGVKANPKEYEINLLGHLFYYNDAGELYDRRWGLVGSLNCSYANPFDVTYKLASKKDCIFLEEKNGRAHLCTGSHEKDYTRDSLYVARFRRSGILNYLLNGSPWCSKEDQSTLSFFLKHGQLLAKSNKNRIKLVRPNIPSKKPWFTTEDGAYRGSVYLLYRESNFATVDQSITHFYKIDGEGFSSDIIHDYSGEKMTKKVDHTYYVNCNGDDITAKFSNHAFFVRPSDNLSGVIGITDTNYCEEYKGLCGPSIDEE